jgi:hypothetical protein
MPRLVGADDYRRLRQSRQVLSDQHRQIEHAKADRYDEKPHVQLTSYPVEADQVLLHQPPRAPSLATAQHWRFMLRCEIKTRKPLTRSPGASFAKCPSAYIAVTKVTGMVAAAAKSIASVWVAGPGGTLGSYDASALKLAARPSEKTEAVATARMRR